MEIPNTWHVFKADGNNNGAETKNRLEQLPDPPSWRDFNSKTRHSKYQCSPEELHFINAAIYLRRPLLLTGNPGVGKSSLAYAIAEELDLGKPLIWPITNRSQLLDGLYRYDAIARLQDSALLKDRKNQQDSEPLDNHEGISLNIEDYIRLGPLGSAFALSERKKPKVLLIDEIDKSDINLSNDLLHVLEEGRFEIEEISRLLKKDDDGDDNSTELRTHDSTEQAKISNGEVKCQELPIIIMTSNDQKQLPAALLRRCIRLDIQPPKEEKLKDIIETKFNLEIEENAELKPLLQKFLEDRSQAKNNNIATDQLLNAIYLLLEGIDPVQNESLLETLFRELE